jgi:hypothetical protein
MAANLLHVSFAPWPLHGCRPLHVSFPPHGRFIAVLWPPSHFYMMLFLSRFNMAFFVPPYPRIFTCFTAARPDRKKYHDFFKITIDKKEFHH